jgi:hypothetical protein
MTLEPVYLSLPSGHDGAGSQAPHDTDAAQAGQPLRPTHTLVSVAAPQLALHPLKHHDSRGVGAPGAGELHLWRFRCEWLPVAVQEGDMWLSKAERERARLHPNPALRKRFVSGRVVTRWIVAHLFDCDPHSVDLQDDGNEKLRARHPHDGRDIVIDVAYGGIWIVIGVASARLGLSVVVPAPGTALDHAHQDFRQRARYDSLCNALRPASVDIDRGLLSGDATASAFDLAGHGRWHVLDLPMSGKIRAAVALAHPVTRVHAFGWPKSFALGKSHA